MSTTRRCTDKQNQLRRSKKQDTTPIMPMQDHHIGCQAPCLRIKRVPRPAARKADVDGGNCQIYNAAAAFSVPVVNPSSFSYLPSVSFGNLDLQVRQNGLG